ncbi:GAF and ANTAR domain-containing protein [Arthrobacter sp. C152]
MVNADAPHDDLFADVARRLQDSFLENPAVEACLQELATYAAARLGDDRQVLCAMTVLRPKKPATAASSSPGARLLSDLEHRYGDGPGTTAMRTGGTVLVGDARRDGRWPEYSQAVAGQGCFSILSIPVGLEGNARGVLSLYSGHPGAYSTDVVGQAEAFVRQAAKGLTLALRMVKLEETKDGMAAAMQTRTVIDLATGAIMAQNRCSQADAFTVLRKASNARNMKLRDVAAAVVSSVAGAEGVSTYFDE